MKALVTGAGGFIGSHLLRALRRRGRDTKGLVRVASDLRNLEGQDHELVHGDILVPDTLEAAMKGCDLVFHTASYFTYRGISDDELRKTAVSGIRNVVEAAARCDVGRVVLTSSSVSAGSRSVPRPVAEDESFDVRREPAYVRAKAEQERLAFALGSSLDVEVVAVCPTLTVGGPDYRLSESNRMIVDYLKDPLKASWIGGCNIVGIEDVVMGHILAAEKGRAGRRYVFGADNLEWQDVHRTISQLTGLPGPWLVAWETAALIAAAAQEAVSSLTGKPAVSTRAQARMVGRYYWYEQGASRELGYEPASSLEALAGAVSWLVASSHVPADIRAQMSLSREVYAWRS